MVDLLEADLDEFWGIDLVDFFRGKISCRKLLNRIRQLPASSRMVKKDLGVAAEWNQLEYFAADIIDMLNVMNYNFANYMQRMAKHPKKLKAPQPIKRPGEKAIEQPDQKKVFATKNQFNKMLQKKIVIDGIEKTVQ